MKAIVKKSGTAVAFGTVDPNALVASVVDNYVKLSKAHLKVLICLSLGKEGLRRLLKQLYLTIQSQGRKCLLIP
jgi:hypothetical protein